MLYLTCSLKESVKLYSILKMHGVSVECRYERWGEKSSPHKSQGLRCRLNKYIRDRNEDGKGVSAIPFFFFVFLVQRVKFLFQY